MAAAADPATDLLPLMFVDGWKGTLTAELCQVACSGGSGGSSGDGGGGPGVQPLPRLLAPSGAPRLSPAHRSAQAGCSGAEAATGWACTRVQNAAGCLRRCQADCCRPRGIPGQWWRGRSSSGPQQHHSGACSVGAARGRHGCAALCWPSAHKHL